MLAPAVLFPLGLVLVVALFTATLICYDEFVFHRKRCDRFGTAATNRS